MSASSFSLIFQSVSALALLFVMFLVWRTDQRIDIFRQRMFSIRDDLFDFAQSGRIDFQHPAYQLLRNSMNGFIRYAHRLTFFQLLFTLARWEVTEQVHPLTWHTKWTEALALLPDDVQTELRGFHGRAMDAVTRQLVLGSAVLFALLIVAVAHRLVEGAWTSLRTMLRDAAEEVITRIFDQKVLEEEAARAA